MLDEKFITLRPERVKWDRLYRGLISRCYNKNDSSYSQYGARGIDVCEKWRNDKWEFVAWCYEQMHRQGLRTNDIGQIGGWTLDRIDNSLGYSPWNCKWSNRQEQGRNTRNNNIITAFGESKTVAEWAEDKRCMVSKETLYYRSKHMDKDAEVLLTSPPNKGLIGESNNVAVLNTQQVLEIRRKHSEGESMASLARELDVGESTVRNVVQRRTWKHIA